MRYVNIDLSSDNYLQEPQIFGGYAGEHNETILQVKLPNRMVDIECSGYRFDFQTSEDNKISSPLIPVSELHDYTLSFKLAEQLTVAGKLLFNVVAISSDENSDKNLVSLISKTNRAILLIEDSTEGNPLLIDPNGYKDELQKMVDERVSQIGIAKGEKGDKGDKGERGISGVYIGSGDMPDGYNVQIDPNGSAYELPVIDQSYNPESENAQSGKAVAEALKSKVLVDVTLTEEQVASGISGISVAIEDIEAYHNAKQVNIYVEMPFKEKALPNSTIAINVSDGAAYADYYGWQHGVTCPQGNTLYWHIFNVRESFHKSNSKKKMCSYYRAPVYYEEPNSLGTCSCLYGGVTHLASLKNHPPKLNLYWSSGGATLEAGTRVFMEVYE